MTEQLELIQQNTIRIETALSRFPVHKLARKRGGIIIDIRETTSTGELKTRWKVSYNSEYGQPGPLAYKVDTLIINRRIDDERPYIPKIIKLGSLSELCRELGARRGGGNANDIKKALMQNVGAIISAKLSYKATDGTERTIEAGFSRYSVIFTGERFPDGRKANAVYILLNDIYLKVLNEAQTRPLDYDYLRDLPPAAQRFYELIGFQIYAVLKHERPRARLSYSDFCTRAPQTRYLDWEHVRKQMYKVHAPHLKSGYLANVEFQEQRGENGELDWLMLYTPGRRAKAEFNEASKKLRSFSRPQATKAAKPTNEARPPSLSATTEPQPAAAIHEVNPEDEQLVNKLVSFHIVEATARELVRDYRRSVELQLRALPHRNLGKIRDLAAWLIAAIKESHQLPEPIIEAQAKEEEVRKAKAKRELELARQRRKEALQPAYYDYLRGRVGEIEKEQPEGYRAFLAKAAGERAEIENSHVFKSNLKERLLTDFDHEEEHLKRLQIFFNEPSFEEWLQSNEPSEAQSN
jgi:hypothetical protein